MEALWSLSVCRWFCFGHGSEPGWHPEDAGLPPETEPLQRSELGIAWVKQRGPGEEMQFCLQMFRLRQAAFKTCPFLAIGCRLPFSFQSGVHSGRQHSQDSLENQSKGWNDCTLFLALEPS